MALRIDSPAVEQLARELVEATGESLTEAVETAIRERLDRQTRGARARRIRRRMDALRAELCSLPRADNAASGVLNQPIV
ncbi:type II toxin-antitoxin system VapB family antitoxin [Glycomyces sp. MUSA5-2]|uniref:type II toxin-antitoxin system VapB family antitoxin n=1 Tax=Glycomyces sp. MUSA5-2 TaxID=2053002 RepID=UPI00300AF988